MTAEKSTKKPKEINIYQRLHAVMRAVSYVKKEDKKVNNQYNFASHDGVTAAVRPHLVDNGVMAVPQNLKVRQDGNRTEAYFDLRFVNIDDPEDFIDVPTFGYGIDPQDKGAGKALSYGVKYALLKALSLETGDDPERDNINHAPAEEIKAQPTPEQVRVVEFIGRVKKEVLDAPTSEDVSHVIHKHANELAKLTPQQQEHVNKYAFTQKGKKE